MSSLVPSDYTVKVTLDTYTLIAIALIGVGLIAMAKIK